MILVVGATGLLGLETCRQLAARGRPVRALVRPTAGRDKVEELRRLGAETVPGDLKDRPSLEAACRGVDAVISTASSTLSRQPGDSIRSVDLKGQLGLVDAAWAAGVGHFDFVSFRDHPGLRYPLDDAKRAVEQHLRSGGMSYTILQAGFFMEVWLSPALGFDYPNAQARIYGEGTNGISWVSSKDVARFAVASPEAPAARDAVLGVGGPEAMSPLEVVRTFEEVGGRPFAVEHVPVEALRARKAGATDPLEESFAALMLTYAEGDPIEMGPTLEAVPLRLASVREYAEGVLAST